MNIIKKHCPNYEDRRGCVPDMIANHITGGSRASSAINTFMNPANEVSSNYIVDTDGTITEMVPPDMAAWANGTSNDQSSCVYYGKATNLIVKSRAYNANLYTVSIEHVNAGGGKLTPQQLEATIWLHKYIIDYVQAHYNHTIPADRDHIVGHCEIDPIPRPYCPGKVFPYAAIIAGLQMQAGTVSPVKYSGPAKCDRNHVDLGKNQEYDIGLTQFPDAGNIGHTGCDIFTWFAAQKNPNYPSSPWPVLMRIRTFEKPGYGHLDLHFGKQIITVNVNVK